MTEGSKLLLYLLMAFTGSILFVVLFSLGPLGWFLIAFLIIAMMIVNARKDTEDRSPDRTNCASCGAPNSPDRKTCTHCGDSL